jgi:2-polyprenyl-6-hydroxyphenyl methylase/3-demethylubiquinone-9 3-methyltransferase
VESVLRNINTGDLVVELGCGYGGVIPDFTEKAGFVYGIDTSQETLRYGRKSCLPDCNCFLLCADAIRMPFRDRFFDAVICIQNGISAFHVDQRTLIEECFRVTKRGGKILISSYSEKFWEHRLEWFELQSRAGLLGEIDYNKTGDGLIVCRDGFTASTVSREQFKKLTDGINGNVDIFEIDNSSIFCLIIPY